MLKIYAGKKILVTGHTGFKGAWLSLWLQELGSEVIGYSLDAPSQPNMFEIARVDEGMTSLRGDIRDFEDLLSIINRYNPEIIFHLAAQSLVIEAQRNPKFTYETNVTGTMNLLEAARVNGKVKVLVNVTSDKVYQNQEDGRRYLESDELGGDEPYSSSKACSEIITNAYLKTYFERQESELNVCTARAGNVIGGGDWAKHRLIPDCIRSFEKSEQIVLRNPQAIRPWQYVLEPLLGYLILGERLYKHGKRYSGSWNFGPKIESTVTVGEIIEKVCSIWGENSSFTIQNEFRDFRESETLALDSTKSERLLGWGPRLDLNESLEWVLGWYKYHFANNGDMKQHSIGQITNYMKLE